MNSSAGVEEGIFMQNIHVRLTIFWGVLSGDWLKYPKLIHVLPYQLTYPFWSICFLIFTEKFVCNIVLCFQTFSSETRKYYGKFASLNWLQTKWWIKRHLMMPQCNDYNYIPRHLWKCPLWPLWSCNDTGVHQEKNLGPFSISEKTSFRKPGDWYFKLSYRFEIWQAHRQQCWRSACQISEGSDNSKYKSCGFETSRDLTKRRLFGYWDRVQMV